MADCHEKDELGEYLRIMMGKDLNNIFLRG